MNSKKFLDNMVKGGVTDFEVCHRKIKDGKSIFTKWYKYTDWPYPNLTPNYRTIFRNELVFETDHPLKEENDKMVRDITNYLEKKGVPYYSIFTGNKSTHVHVFINHPHYDDDVINNNKHRIAKHILSEELYNNIDKANLGKHRMIQLEFSYNPKTGVQSKLCKKFKGDIYSLPYDFKLMDGIRFKDKQTSFMVNKTEVINNKAPRYCPFIEYCCKNELPTIDNKKHTMSRNQYIAPNVAAYVLANKDKAEYLESYYTNQKSPVKREWLGLKPEFNCTSLQEYADNNGLSKHCKFCKKYGLYDKYKTYIAIKARKANPKNTQEVL